MPQRRVISLALGGAAFGVAYLTAYSAFALVRVSAHDAGTGAAGADGAWVPAYSRCRAARCRSRCCPWWARSSRRHSPWTIRVRAWCTATTWRPACSRCHGDGSRLASAHSPELPVHARGQRVLRLDRRLLRSRATPRSCFRCWRCWWRCTWPCRSSSGAGRAARWSSRSTRSIYWRCRWSRR